MQAPGQDAGSSHPVQDGALPSSPSPSMRELQSGGSDMEHYSSPQLRDIFALWLQAQANCLGSPSMAASTAAQHSKVHAHLKVNSETILGQKYLVACTIGHCPEHMSPSDMSCLSSAA